MAEIATLEEAQQVHTEAARVLGAGDYQLAHDLLMSLDGCSVLSNDLWTEIRVQLGDTSLQLGDVAAARQFYDEGATLGAGSFKEQAVARLADLEQYAAASTAAGDGVDRGEYASVLAAAEEARGRQDWDAAAALYQQAYGAPGVSSEDVGKIGTGLAECCLNLREFERAADWCNYVLVGGSPDSHARATELLAAITAHQEAVAASGDGVGIAELASVFTEAVAAYNRGDYESALQMWTGILENPMVDTGRKSKVLFNLGQVHRMRHEWDEARRCYEQSAALGNEQAATYAAEGTGYLDQMDQALQTAGLTE